ncbi:MAG: hypothetical protein HEQ29_19410 [Dolichospermum sp. LBC05a]|nr:hypothetical protein [Dolichospermum sp. OL01]MCO5798824.1 hypothetical protein [Dolichospermum sp. OL03]MCS6282011.1 hypothetical protein [Dolichospermum sp.]QSV60229.1 MAG: hypothetical protein HEQ29_19410 [Dolichospermum sp. LBC05a]
MTLEEMLEKLTWKEIAENLIEEGAREGFKEQVFPVIASYVSEQAPVIAQQFMNSILQNFRPF